MRFVVRAQIPTEAGNKMLQNLKFLQDLEDYIRKAKPEASFSLKLVVIELWSL
jgi:hypothetical protein